MIPQQYARLMTAQDLKAVGGETYEDACKRGDAKLERDLQHKCEQYLQLHQVVYLHLSPRAREKEGWPDLVFMFNRIPYAIELKTATGKLTTAQEELLEQMREQGWMVAVCRSFADFIDRIHPHIKG